MHRFYSNRLGLCEEAAEQSPAPGGAATSPATAAPEPGAGDTPPAPEVKVGLKERVLAIVAGGGANAQTIANLQAQVSTLTTERDTALSQFATAQATITGLQAQVTTLQAERQSVEDALAGIGIPPANLPAQAPAGAAPADSIDELQAKLDSTKDPKARGELVMKIRAMREKETAVKAK